MRRVLLLGGILLALFTALAWYLGGPFGLGIFGFVLIVLALLVAFAVALSDWTSRS